MTQRRILLIVGLEILGVITIVGAFALNGYLLGYYMRGRTKKEISK